MTEFRKPFKDMFGEAGKQYPSFYETMSNRTKTDDITETQQKDVSDVPPVVPPQQEQTPEVQPEEQVAQQTDVTPSEKPKTAPDSSFERLRGMNTLTPSQQQIQQLPPEPALPKTATHIVRAGDTISDIARRFGVGVNDVTGFKSGNPNLIFPGETLSVGGVKTKAPVVPTKKLPEQMMMEQPETPEESNALVEATFAETGVTPNEEAFVVNPYKAFEDIYSRLYETLQIGMLEESIKTMLDDFAEVDRKMKEELEKVNENPWTSQQTKTRRSQQVTDKYGEQKTNLTNRISLYESKRDKARDEIRFMSETALNQYNIDREFEQDRLDDIADRAGKEKKAGYTLGKDQIRFDEFNNVVARGVDGTTLGDGSGVTGDPVTDAVNSILQPFSGFKLSDISTKDNLRGRVANALATKKAEALESGDIFGIITASAGGKDVSDTFLNSLEKAMNTMGQLEELQASISGEETGPIWGTIRSNNPYDAKAKIIEGQLNSIVPNLARGIYGEVGVLTDNDVKIYSKTLPNLKSVEEVRTAMLGLTVLSIQRSIENKIANAGRGNRDVSGFLDVYTQIKATADELLASIEPTATQIQPLSVGSSGTTLSGISYTIE